MPQWKAADVRRYYDENTRLLLGLGQGTEGTIHRAVWGPGVTTRVRAMRYVESLVADRARQLQVGAAAPLHFADLGCGIGASLCRLVDACGGTGIGLTISHSQYELAQSWIERQGLSSCVQCRVADFCDLPADLAGADVAYAIEAFVHAPSSAAFFQQAANLVRTGGMLLVCDDFVAPATESARARHWRARFARGWRIGSLVSEVEAERLAASTGFELVETLDLTPWLETWASPRLGDRCADAYALVAAHFKQLLVHVVWGPRPAGLSPERLSEALPDGLASDGIVVRVA